MNGRLASAKPERYASCKSVPWVSDAEDQVMSIEDELRQKLSVKVEIKQKAKDKGQLILSFESFDDFERIVEVLRR